MKIFVLLAVVGLMSQSINLHAEVSPAIGYTSITYKEYESNHHVSWNTFGLFQAVPNYNGGYVRNGIGEGTQTPVIDFKGSNLYARDSNERIYDPEEVHSLVNYHWKITSKDGSSDPVPVHIHTEGSVSYDYSWAAFKNEFSGEYTSPVPGDMNVGVQAYFHTVGSEDMKYGVTVGNRFSNRGVSEGEYWTSTIVDSDGRTIGGGSSGDGVFNQDFDILAKPNFENTINIDAQEWLAYPIDHRYGFEVYHFAAYIDPVITIDPAYADRYTLEVSYIPYAPLPVPEPESYLLLLAGLSVIFVATRRSSQVS